VRRADVDDVREAPDAVITIIKVERDFFLTFGQQRLQLSHGYSVVLGVVEREVADLQKGNAKCE